MDTNSPESSITTKSAELMSKTKKRRERRKAKKRETKQREDLMPKNVEAPRNEESSVEDMASIKKSEMNIDATVQLLPIGHPDIEKESARKRKRMRRKMMKAMNNNADPSNNAAGPSSMGQSDVLSNPGLSNNKDGEVDATAQLLPIGHQEIEKKSAEGLLEKNTVRKRKRKKRKRMKVMNNNADPSSMGKSDVLSDPGLPNNKDREVDATARLVPIGHPEIEKKSAEGLLGKNTVGKRKRKKRKRTNAMNNNADPSSMGQSDVLSNPGLLNNKDGEVDATAQLLPIGHPEIEKKSAEGLPEKNTVGKRKRKKRKRTKAMNNNTDPSCMGQNGDLSSPRLLDNKLGEVENVLLNPNILTRDSASSERKATETLCMADNFATELSEEGHNSSGVGRREVNIGAEEKKRDSDAKQANRDNVKVADENVKGEVSLFQAGRISAGSCIERAKLSRNSELTMPVISASVSAGGPRLGRKLLILDVNGLLADIVHPPPKHCKPDACFYRRAIFKRPYCDDFLKFCFEKFDVAIWSSRSKNIIVKVVDYLLGKLKHKLLFCWDMWHSTETNFKTLDNKYKPLVCKELRKVWDRYDPSLPWNRGDYDESNTLLLDDSPYKALLNPEHTAIFPASYNFQTENDNSLGPGGDLRIYLEELLKAEHVQKFVEQHPFGQRAIDETSSDWNFYSGVLGSLHIRSGQTSLSAHGGPIDSTPSTPKNSIILSN